MTPLRTIALAVGAIALEIASLLLTMGVTFNVFRLTSDSVPDISYAARASLAVATTSLWLVTAGATVFVALRLGRRRLRVNLLGAVFIVAVFNGLALYPFLAYASWANDATWDVPFPLGGRNEFR
ncbi:MAG: hypothetical protein HY874_02020 [Chloroflexi bacterium]|nr:hypothetical protein [Chloroflexota bacterium]